MSAGAAGDEVRHEPAAGSGRFVIARPEGTSVLEYSLQAGAVDFHHTEVPPALRGQGLAEKLVRAGLGWAEQTGRKVVPSCSYVAAFLNRHAEFGHLRAGAGP